MHRSLNKRTLKQCASVDCPGCLTEFRNWDPVFQGKQRESAGSAPTLNKKLYSTERKKRGCALVFGSPLNEAVGPSI